jgi:ribosome assembly protein YihI (activator of Der GTPase)|tara:strand:+ start:704 stop:883 length:180 start_codon:yes stop_codon:yes gene_type:complete
MPSHSPAQARMMAAAAHDPKFAKKVGVPVSVAQDYNQADKGKRLAEAMKSMDRKKNEGG